MLFLLQCSNSLLNLEKSIKATLGRRIHGRPQRSDDFDCTLCLKLLYEPITTPCGHSFCRACLFQSMDRCKFRFACSIFRDFSYMLNYNQLLFFLSLFLTLLIFVDNRCPLCRTVLFISPRTCAIRLVAYGSSSHCTCFTLAAETALSLFFFFFLG